MVLPMIRNSLKQAVHANRGIVLTLLIISGLHLLVLGVIAVLTFANRHDPEAGLGYIVYIAIVMFINLWVLVLCNVSLYTSGFTIAVCAGMQRTAYLRAAGGINLIYIGVLFVLTLCASLLCTGFIQAGEGTATDVKEMVMVLGALCPAQVILHLFYTALGMMMGALILRYGVKLVVGGSSLLSLIVIMLPMWIEGFFALPQNGKYLAALIICLCAVTVTAILLLTGRRMLRRQSI